MYDCRYWVWLSTKFEPGSIKCDKLLQQFNYNPKAIYEAERSEYEKVCGPNLRLLNALCDKSLDRVTEILEFCEKTNAGILTQDDPRYPSSLLRIDGQPPVIYYKGTLPDFNNRFSISIVGTRTVTSYGSSAAYTISHDIAAAGGIIVSGMALGADTAAHRGALDVKGTTVAFLGCGIDIAYPKENAALMKEIIQSGVVMTDYPPHSRPEGRHFPVRNRLISGVSHGVLIVEAAKRSGALITADHARKQGKLLYAIPGRIGELNSEGSNNLLIAGAKTVLKSSDIIRDFRLLFDLDKNVDMSAFRHFKATEHPIADLKQPYQTPTYNPYATEKGSYSDKKGAPKYYDHYIPYPPEKSEEAPKQEVQTPVSSAPIYRDLNQTSVQEDKVSVPRPTIIYKDFDGDEFAKSYMSMSADRKEELEDIQALVGRKYLTYPEGPIPKGGYKINMTSSKTGAQADAEKIISIDSHPTQRTLKQLSTPEQIMQSRLADNERKPSSANFRGLTSVEIDVLKFLKNGKTTVDSMASLGIPLPKLLSVLTLLEIKHLVIQHPGGYFELK